MENDLSDIYNELIMEHSMNSCYKKNLANADFTQLGHNPSCGDEITIQIKLNGNVIEDMAFSGHGCAISQASTSIMIETLKGKSVEEAKEVIKTFIGMIDRDITDDNKLEVLEDAIAFKNISNMPARVKCAILAWRTLEKILDENYQANNVVTTEDDGTKVITDSFKTAHCAKCGDCDSCKQ